MIFAEIEPALLERIIGKFVDYGILGLSVLILGYFFIKWATKMLDAHERFIDAQIECMKKQEIVHSENGRALKSIEESNRVMAKHITEGNVCKFVKGTTA